jgi:chromosome segregation ATPase
MISIHKEIDAADQLHSRLAALCECYRSAINNSREYAVDVDPSITAEFQKALSAISERIQANSSTPEALASLRSLLREVMRDHKEEAEKYLRELRRRLDDNAAALSEVMGALASSNDSSDQALRAELRSLSEVANLATLAEMRGGVLTRVNALAKCIDGIEKQNRLAIAQLRHEIQVLHQQVEQLNSSRAASIPPPASPIRDQVEAKISSGVPFSLLFVGIKNLNSIRSSYGGEVAHRTLSSCEKKLANAVRSGTETGQWEDGVLAALICTEPPLEADLARRVSAKLSGKHILSDSREVMVQVATVTLTRTADEPAKRTFTRIQHAIKALGYS